MDTSHLDSIFNHLDRERERADLEPTLAGKAFRHHNIKQIERELAAELEFLGIKMPTRTPMTEEQEDRLLNDMFADKT